MAARYRIAALLCALGLLRAPAPARAIDLRFEPSILGQVRDGDGYFPGPTEVPVELYGDFGLSGLPHGTVLDTYFRLQDDFANANNTETDFFAGAIRVPSAPGNLDVALGRQIVAESPVGMWDADSGQVRVGLGDSPFSLTAFGGQAQYWEPIFGPPAYSEDEQIFGGSVRVASYTGGALALGYLQQNRAGSALMQQVTLSGTRTFAQAPGAPSLYGNFAFDADHANIDQVRLGVQSAVWLPELLVNFESGYYKPQDNGDTVVQDLNRREDPIFQLFSISDLLQFRGGTRYALTRTVSTYADLSYQRYERTKDNYVNGYVWSTGVLYLPGGDGLEVVRAEYYGYDSAGGTVNGAKLVYENRVYEDILFRAMCNVGAYAKATNQSGTAVGSLIGVGYMFLPGLVGEVNFEANRNQFYPEDFRFGFFISYSADYGFRGGVHRSRVGNQNRPWPWAPTQFGPASWGAAPATWSANPSLPASGWAASSFAAAATARSAADEAAEDEAETPDAAAPPEEQP
ncbi:MAG: hypothetical protein SF182_29630 [Deltaproteobacteria bacterium]|nr:hypothetical protein [Deltaproteobacteria bacterium]